MTHSVLCLRPNADFARADALPPAALDVSYHGPADAEVPALMRTARALVIPAVGPKLAPSLFEGSTLALVQVTGAGLDRLDQPTLTRLGIPVANVPGGSNSAVAEYAVTSASLLLRRLAWADTEIREGNYAAFRARMLADNLAGLDGMLVGIVGLGVVGLAVAQAFHRMGCRICYYDPAVLASEASGQRGDPISARAGHSPEAGSSAPAAADRVSADTLDAAAVSLDELLERADVVSLHVPLLDTTRGLIGARELARMKARAVLVQAARGGVVDEAALAASLRSGHLGGAAVDVYTTEPPATDNPLLALDGEAAQRLLLSPHIAGVTRQSSAFLFRSAWENVERVLVRNEPPRNRAY